jgi:hypothetical protein
MTPSSPLGNTTMTELDVTAMLWLDLSSSPHWNDSAPGNMTELRYLASDMLQTIDKLVPCIITINNT